MIEPNFSESQLQQAVNLSYVRRIHAKYGRWIYPLVPSLVAEYDLGWDTAFFLDWILHPPLDSHEGCNFFLQYKLSCQLTSTGAKEWPHWNAEYFRFKIPHNAKCKKTGKITDDYHQWKCLKSLASRGYPTFYVTNHTLDKNVLKSLTQNGTLLDVVPTLDIRNVANQHKHVTFTETSQHFFLHSKKEDAKKQFIGQVINDLYVQEGRSLAQLNKGLLDILKDIGEKDNVWMEGLKNIDRIEESSLRGTFPRHFHPMIKQIRIASFLRLHLGISMFFLPSRTSYR